MKGSKEMFEEIQQDEQGIPMHMTPPKFTYETDELLERIKTMNEWLREWNSGKKAPYTLPFVITETDGFLNKFGK